MAVDGLPDIYQSLSRSPVESSPYISQVEVAADALST